MVEQNSKALGGLHSIRVNVVGLDDQNREEVTARIKAVRGELDALGWQTIVSVQEKKEDVGIYLKTRGKEAVEGLVITVLDGRKEAVFINIVGDIKMDKIGALGDKLNLDALKKAAEALMKQAAAAERIGLSAFTVNRHEDVSTQPGCVPPGARTSPQD